MIPIAFIIAMVGMYLTYHLHGTQLFGFSIYSIGMVGVMASTVWVSRKSAECLWALLPIVVMTVVAWVVPWSWTPPIRMLTHIGLAVIFLNFGQHLWQFLLAYIYLLSSLVSSLQILGTFPHRPHVFSGIYYADLVAYLTYSLLMVIGYGAGDAGKLVVDSWPRRYSRHNHGAVSRVEVAKSAKD